MGNPTQRRKVKNPTHKGRKTKIKRKVAIPDCGFREHWDSKRSLAHNYNALGLMRSVNKIKGGMIGAAVTNVPAAVPDLADCENMTNEELSRAVGSGFGIIERDEDGNIVNVIIAEKEDVFEREVKPAPAKTEFVKELEERASRRMPYQPRVTEFESSMIRNLLNKHGEDFTAMARDIKLNPDQLTPAQLKKLIGKFKASTKQQ